MVASRARGQKMRRPLPYSLQSEAGYGGYIARELRTSERKLQKCRIIFVMHGKLTDSHVGTGNAGLSSAV